MYSWVSVTRFALISVRDVASADHKENADMNIS